MRHFFFILLIWSMALVVFGSGCAAVSHDMARKHADNLGPGITVEGSEINIWRDKNGVIIVVKAPKNAMAEIRDAQHIRTINDTSSFEFLRLGSRPKTMTTTDVDAKGGINLFGKQTVAGLTVLNLILIIAAVLIAPLVIGGVLSMVPYSTVAALGIGIIGFYKGLIPSGIAKPSVKTTVTDTKMNTKTGVSKVTTTESTSKGK